MKKAFKCIGLVGLPRHKEGLSTHEFLYRWLRKQDYTVLIENDVMDELDIPDVIGSKLEDIGCQADLVIVVGGDGNMLRAARIFAHNNIRMIGVNRGSLGFLTDLSPENVEGQLQQVLNGVYLEDTRFLLEAIVYRGTQEVATYMALNEVVLHSGLVAKLIGIDVYINGNNAFSQRSDGLIISTPTGSTAYSLSAGGTILEPSLEAIALVPMFPHSLTARPLVVHSSSLITVQFSKQQEMINISCDGQESMQFNSAHYVVVKRSPFQLRLIHPQQYNYFNTLTSKLGWSAKFV